MNLLFAVVKTIVFERKRHAGKHKFCIHEVDPVVGDI